MSETEFMKQAQQLIDLAEAENFSEVQKLVSSMKVEFHEKLGTIGLWQACVYALQTDYEAALNELQELLDEGYWWNPNSLRNEPDLAHLQTDPRLQKIIEECEERLREERDRANVVVEEFGNPNSDSVIIALHWRGSNIKSFSDYWLNERALDNYRFVFIQSSQVHGPNSFSWDDPDIAKQDVVQSLNNVELSGKKVIFAGASQGALIAIEEVLARKDAQGFIAVVPAIKDIHQLKQQLGDSYIGNKRGVIVTGTEDSFYEKSSEAAAVLNEAGIQTELIVKDGLGHFFPDDFKEIEEKAIKDLSEIHI